MQNSCIVLGDTHQNVLEGIRGLLETMFEGVVMVADQQSLSRALDKMKPALAIVDLSLLGQGEIDVVRRFSESFPDVSFIVLSDYNEPNIAADVISSGASGFVLKQYAGTDLFEAIQSINEGHSFVSPAAKDRHDSQDNDER